MKNPQVTIKLASKGEIIAELYPDIAPNTVKNFISLAKKNFYKNSIFHRCIKGFMIQGGIPADMKETGYCIKGEFSSNGFNNSLKHTDGVLSMARTSIKDSASCQFFIMTSDSPHLDGQYAAFGKVIKGMEYVYAIENEPVDFDDRPIYDQVIESVSVDTFGVEYDEPEKIIL